MYSETMVYTVGVCYQSRVCEYKLFIARSEHEAVEMAKNRQALSAEYWFTETIQEDERVKKQDLYKVYSSNKDFITAISASHPSDATNKVKQSLWHEILSIKRQEI